MFSSFGYQCAEEQLGPFKSMKSERQSLIHKAQSAMQPSIMHSQSNNRNFCLFLSMFVPWPWYILEWHSERWSSLFGYLELNGRRKVWKSSGQVVTWNRINWSAISPLPQFQQPWEGMVGAPQFQQLWEGTVGDSTQDSFPLILFPLLHSLPLLLSIVSNWATDKSA